MKTIQLQPSARRLTPPRPKKKSPLSVLAVGTQSVVLYNVPWQTYQDLCDAQGERHIRMTFDRGTLEIMSVSASHEWYKSLFGYLILALAIALDKKMGAFGSFTHRRKDLAKALEPDQCFYFTHFDQVRGKKDIDLNVDPPPDLAVEIEISRSALDRLIIFALLGVPEVWRFDGEHIFVHILRDGKYEEAAHSSLFPEVSLQDCGRFFDIARAEGIGAMMKAVETWAKKKKARKGAKKK